MPKVPKQLLVLLLVVVSAFVLFGCGGKQAGQGQPAVQPKAAAGASGSSSQADWQKKWADLRQAAEKEGELVLNTAGNGPDAKFLTALTKKWEEDGFKIKLYATNMPSSEFQQKFKSEWVANIHSIDAVITGLGTQSNFLKPMGALAAIDESMFILPEVKDPKKWYGDILPYADKEKNILNPAAQVGTGIWVNSNKIKPNDLKTMQDLLKPEYKGRIAMGDFRINGSPSRWFAVAVETGTLDKDFLMKLKNQNPVMTPDNNLLTQWIATGKYDIGVGITPSLIQKMKLEGAPVAPALEGQGAYIAGGGGSVSLISKAPHPKAAELFLNWYLTKDVQAAITPSLGYPSARVDVPTKGLSPEAVRKDNIKYFNAGTEDFQLKVPGFHKLAEDVFGKPGKGK